VLAAVAASILLPGCGAADHTSSGPEMAARHPASSAAPARDREPADPAAARLAPARLERAGARVYAALADFNELAPVHAAAADLSGTGAAAGSERQALASFRAALASIDPSGAGGEWAALDQAVGDADAHLREIERLTDAAAASAAVERAKAANEELARSLRALSKALERPAG
jgi:hypothetical protein